MKIANLVVGVAPMFQSTREYCKPYLSEKEPELWVRVTGEDLVFQQALLEREALEEGLKIRKFQDPFLERATIQRRVADALLCRDTLMLHGSTVSVDGRAYLFTAPCGTGKSTHTRLWREVFGDRAVMINDDMPFLQIGSDGVFAWGSPWCGKHGLGTNICVPLQGICFLSRGKENEIHPAAAADYIPTLRHQAHTPVDAALQEKVGSLVDVLASKTDLWEMSCNTDPLAAKVAHEAMRRK